MSTEQNTAPDPGYEPPLEPGALDERMEEGNEVGSIRIHNNVIASIARLAALKVPGVAELSASVLDGLAGMLGKKASGSGIRVELTEEGVLLDVHVVLEYGVRIPQVSWQLQNDIKNAVEHMTGKSVLAVNITVQSVRLPESRAAAQNKGMKL